MRRASVAALLLTLSITTAHAQETLTRDQRISDLTQLASQYDKNYGPYEAVLSKRWSCLSPMHGA